MSRALRPYTKAVLGVDISQGMVDQYNKHVEEQGISPEEMKAVCIDLKGEEKELDGAKFDVVTVSYIASVLDMTTHTRTDTGFDGIPPSPRRFSHDQDPLVLPQVGRLPHSV